MSEQAPTLIADTVWLLVSEAADRARCSTRTIYNAARSGELRCAHVGGRRSLRFRREWIDLWLERTSEPSEDA